MPLTLQITEGHANPLSRTFQEGENVLVGRDPEADFRISEDDLYFARKQFVLELTRDHYRLVALKTKSGTYVNGVRVDAARLDDGDVIKGGLKTKILVRIDPPAKEDTPPESFSALPPTKLLPQTPLSTTQVQRDPPGSGSRDSPVVPGYRLLEELGRGGMGVVYRAVREADRRVVAIKTIRPEVRPSPQAVTRFVRESAIVRTLDHPGIVAGLDSGESNGTLWLAMEFIDGTDGRSVLKSEGPLSIPRAVEWTRQLLEALAYAHDRDFIHRDVKPANLMVSPGEGGERVRLTDFGLARAYQVSMMSAVTSGITSSGHALGTVKFMPPEQLRDARSAKPAADQYAAAATLYQFLTGKYLFEDVTTEVEWYMQILDGTPTPIERHRPEIPPPLAAAVHRALARKPAERFPSVREFSRAIREAAG